MTPLSPSWWVSGSLNQRPPWPRYRNLISVPASAVNEADRVPLDRLPSTCVPGVQSLKQPTTLTGPSWTSMGSTHVTVTWPFFARRVLIIRVVSAAVGRRSAPAKHTAATPDRVTRVLTLGVLTRKCVLHRTADGS